MYDQNQSEGTYQYAAPIKRFAAMFIDGIVVGALSFPVGFIAGLVVAASMQGVVLFGTDGEVAAKRERMSFKEMQKRRKT